MKNPPQAVTLAHDHADGDHGHHGDHGDHGHHDRAHHAHHAHHAHEMSGPFQKASRDDLPRGAGSGKLLFLDAPSGLAGDMIIATLVDLGVPEQALSDVFTKLPLEGFHVHFGARVRSGIVATSFDVHVSGTQPERTYRAIRALLDASALPEGVHARASASFRRLAESEAKVHRMPIDDVHFHEVGGVDAIVDIVGSAAALDYLGAKLVVSPLPMGHGHVHARHGILPLPAPATVECLRGLSTYDGGLAFEFVTPTGAAIVGAHAEGSVRWPSLVPERTGWGAGTKDLADRPNLLRAVLGQEVLAAPLGTHVLLETNVDDATGELLAACIDGLLAAGALDAWATPMTMKKGRPAYALAALAPRGLEDVVASAMLRESTSLGVRRMEVSRLERPRRMVSVDTPFGVLPVKVAEGPFGPPQYKPEFDACLAAARAHGVPVRAVLQAALVASYVEKSPI